MLDVKRIEKRWFNRGYAAGLHNGQRCVVARQLNLMFGELDVKTSALFGTLPYEEISKLSNALLRFTELKDLTNWLKRHQPRPANQRALEATAQSKQ